jgi:hypothetical protein
MASSLLSRSRGNVELLSTLDVLDLSYTPFSSFEEQAKLFIHSTCRQLTELTSVSAFS